MAVGVEAALTPCLAAGGGGHGLPSDPQHPAGSGPSGPFRRPGGGVHMSDLPGSGGDSPSPLRGEL